MAEEYGPWIEHDGARPTAPPPGQSVCNVQFANVGIEPPDEFRTIAEFLDWPGFYWRWQNVKTGWFSSERRPVCDNPAYAPIMRYRFRKPPVVSAAVEELRRIAENPSAPLPERRPERALP